MVAQAVAVHGVGRRDLARVALPLIQDGLEMLGNVIGKTHGAPSLNAGLDDLTTY